MPITPMPTIGDALYQSSCKLRDAGVGSSSLEASLLLAHATGLDRLQLIVRTGESIDEAQWQAFQRLLDRRMGHEPLQYILGETEFMGLNFKVTPDVLIPRGDTEILVEALLDLEAEHSEARALTVADIGTGSGAIAVVLAKSWPRATVIATDLSTAALGVAKSNAEAHGVAGAIDFRQGDGLAPLTEPVDYMVSNPPYIDQADIAGLDPEVRDFEPHLALTPGADGLHWYRTFATEGKRHVKPGGYLAVEVGQGQADAVVAMLQEAGGWEEPAVLQDLARINRVVAARRMAE